MANNINWGKIYDTTYWGVGVTNNTISWGKVYSDLSGITPSFALNFNTIADDFTFTRNSFGTIVNENGLIETVTNLGSEQVVNGDFDTDTDWVKQSGWSIADSKATYDASFNGTELRQLMPSIAAGETVKIQFNVLDIEAAKDAFFKLDISGSPESVFPYTKFSEGTYTYYHTITSGFNRVTFTALSSSTGGAFSIDNVSVREIVEDDIPRIDYSTGEAAFLLEPQSTNLYLNSENLSTQNVTTLALTYTVSFRGTGTITFSGTHTSSLVGTGSMDLVSTTFLATAGTLISTVSGDVKYAQIEASSYATSYIPTDGSTVTRSAETCVNATPTINNEEGVLYAYFNSLNVVNEYKIIEINDNTGNNRIGVSVYGSSLRGLVKSNGTTQINVSSPQTVTDFNKVAVKWGTDETALWINGVEITTGSGSTFNADVLDILGFVGAGNKYVYGNTKDLKIYDKALTDEELTELTTI